MHLYEALFCEYCLYKNRLSKKSIFFIKNLFKCFRPSVTASYITVMQNQITLNHLSCGINTILNKQLIRYKLYHKLSTISYESYTTDQFFDRWTVHQGPNNWITQFHWNYTSVRYNIKWSPLTICYGPHSIGYSLS